MRSALRQWRAPRSSPSPHRPQVQTSSKMARNSAADTQVSLALKPGQPNALPGLLRAAVAGLRAGDRVRRNRMADAYDVIVIGSGAGGGTLIYRLAPSGKRVLLLERGDWLPREKENWLAEDVFVDNRYVSPETWYEADGKPFQPQVHYFVGGATKLYGAALYRLRVED